MNDLEDRAIVVGLEALLQEGYIVRIQAYGTGLRRRRVVATRGLVTLTAEGCGRDLVQARRLNEAIRSARAELSRKRGEG